MEDFQHLEDHRMVQETHDLPGIQQVELFGGAIKLELPRNVVDVSTFRQVPDTQEVFILRDDPDEDKNHLSNAKFFSNINDLSIIIEVLELVNLKENNEYQEQKKQNGSNSDDDHPNSIIKYHFDSLAYDNSSKSTQIKSIKLPNDLESFYNVPRPIDEKDDPTTSTVTNPRRKTPEPVKLYGLQSVSKFHQSDRDSHDVHIWLGLWRLNGIGNNGNGTDLVLTCNLPQLNSTNPLQFKTSIHLVNQFFQRATKSLEIIDWSLFA